MKTINTNNAKGGGLSINNLILCGLFTAITAVCSQISIPLGFTPVPINLATLAVMLSGTFLGTKGGVMSMVVYILLGAVGLPVFAGFTGGLGVLVGPTGGYIIGYILCVAFIGYFLPQHTARSKSKIQRECFMFALVYAVGILICYAIGTIWFTITTGSTLASSLVLCVVPFIPGDIIKIFISVIISRRSLPIR